MPGRSAFIAQVSRGRSKEVVFAQILTGFLLAGADPKLVAPNPHLLALNLVMPEDWYVPMRDFALHMRILNYLHERYPQVHIALHAGEAGRGSCSTQGFAVSCARFHRDLDAPNVSDTGLT